MPTFLHPWEVDDSLMKVLAVRRLRAASSTSQIGAEKCRSSLADIQIRRTYESS